MSLFYPQLLKVLDFLITLSAPNSTLLISGQKEGIGYFCLLKLIKKWNLTLLALGFLHSGCGL